MRSGCQHVWVLGEFSLLCSHMAERERNLWSLHPLIRTPIPSWGSTSMTSSKPNHLPKALPPNTITLGIRVSTYEFGCVGGEEHKLSVHSRKKKEFFKKLAVSQESCGTSSSVPTCT